MRLTLRPGWLTPDDILDPADHEQLGRRVEESDFANTLLHRSGDVIRRLRLVAPS